MICLARRTVLKGAVAACGAGALAACGGGGDEQGAAPSGATGGTPSGGTGVRASLGAVDDIPVGGAVSTTAPDGSTVLLTRPADGDVQAFSAVCPHEGCTVAPDDEQLTCPCHGSQYELNGDLKRGPARKGLTSFAVRVVDGQVLPA